MNRTIMTMVMACLMTLMAPAADVTPDSTGMTLDARAWTRSVKMGWNLGNALESAGADWDDATGTWTKVWMTNRNEWETAWGNPKTTREMLAAVKAAGYDAVRLPVRWQPHVTDESTMAVDKTWMSRVQQLVDWCMELDLKVILNTHHELWLESHPTYDRQEANNNKLAALWRQIATRFRDYDQRLAFAGMNEVNINWQAPTAENTAVMNSYNQTFVDAVRATGGRNAYRTLIVQTYSCNPHYGLAGLVVPTDEVKGRLAVEFHYYNPYNYCSGAAGSYYYWGNAFKDKGEIAPETETALKNLFAQIRKQWYDQGVGVVVGEFGISNHYTDDDRTTQQQNMQYYARCVVEEARKNGFAAFVWDNSAFGNGSEQFGIFNRKNNMSVDNPWVLNGMVEGAATVFDENPGTGNTVTPDYEGTVVWEGDRALNWGTGLQLTIPATQFAGFTPAGKVVITVTLDPAAGYDDLQLCTSDWKGCAYTIDGTAFTGDYSPRTQLGLSSGTHTLVVSFDATTVERLRQGGLIIQGYGMSLNRVLVSPAGTTGIAAIATTPAHDAIYTPQGVRIHKARRGEVYIRNGRKYVANE